MNKSKLIDAGDTVVLQDGEFVGFALNEAKSDKDVVSVRWGNGNESKCSAGRLVKL